MKEPGRILSIDYGTKRVGVALSDPLRILARPVGTFLNDETLLDRLHGTIETNKVVLILIGMPYSVDGGKGQKAQEVDEFILRLANKVSVPVETWDESLTSVEAHNLLRESGTKQKQRREKGRIDAVAACVMLQEYLDVH